jgi:hypothetical protein
MRRTIAVQPQQRAAGPCCCPRPHLVAGTAHEHYVVAQVALHVGGEVLSVAVGHDAVTQVVAVLAARRAPAAAYPGSGACEHYVVTSICTASTRSNSHTMQQVSAIR